VEETMRRQLAHCSVEGGRALGGLDYLIGVLAATDTRTEQSILAGIAESDPELARELRQRMFTFEDVAALDDRSIQRLLREIAAPRPAWRMAPPPPPPPVEPDEDDDFDAADPPDWSRSTWGDDPESETPEAHPLEEEANGKLAEAEQLLADAHAEAQRVLADA